LNTFHNRGFGRCWLFKWTMAGVAAVCLSVLASALDQNRMISQYMRNSWGTEQGFKGGSVSALAQTTDGYLWIGTEKGLVRFDGLNFRQFEQANPSFSIGPVQTLLADGQGNLWILLRSTKLLRYRDGKFELSRGEAENGITAIGQGARNTILLSSVVMGTLTYSGERFESVSSKPGSANSPATSGAETPDERSTHLSWSVGLVPNRAAEPNSAVISMAETTDGKIWLGTRDKGLFYINEGRVFTAGEGLQNTKITCLLPLDNGELWIGTERGVQKWNGMKLTLAGVPSSLRRAQVLAMIRDRDSNIWIGKAGGLVRVNGVGVSIDEGRPHNSGPVTALFEDREGNLWVGSPRGIERLRSNAFVTYSVADLQSGSSGPVYVDQQGRAWFAPFEGGLHWLKDGKSGSVTNDHLSQDVVYSITGSRDELWIGRRRGGLTHLRYTGGSITTKTYTQADGLAQNGVYAVYQSRDGPVWAATLSGGVSEFRDHHFTTYTTANGMSSNTVYSIAESPDRTMWFGTPNGLTALSKGQWRVYTVRDGLPGDGVNCLLSDSTGVMWIGTGNGLAFLRSGHVQVPSGTPSSLHEQILGIAEDRNGRLWIATSNHVLAAERDKLRGNELSSSDVREYGLEDGLLGTEGVKRHYSVFADPFGRVWFSMNRGVSVVDPARAGTNSAPAIVQIEGLSADGNASDLQQPVRIPPGGHKVTIRYSGLSLSVPERVRFKYKLDEFDQGWSDPVSTREAVYTNLSAGSYRFRVIASNSDGLWNGSESSIPFTIDPAFWQTWWFRFSCTMVIGLTVVFFYRLRLYHLTKEMNVRFEERLAERTRIAQDLHDTLLQGFLSASMQLHVAAEQIPTDSPAGPLVSRVLELMKQVIDEGRATLKGLRSPIGGPHDLAQSFSGIQYELAPEESIDYRVTVEGPFRALHPVIRDEIYHIGREALVNAFRHSGANTIEVELQYGLKQLRILVRDDGRGIDPDLLRSGREGHWGICGMRERAEEIGARLKLWSRARAGTEVELSIPGHIAYESQYSQRPRSWLAKFYSRKIQQDGAEISNKD
jgi:ligand-binding sensor domain-containing protein/signal transduction histidine kinase